MPGQVKEKFSAICEPFLDDVHGDIKDTNMTPGGIRARVLPALNSLLDMSAAYQAGLLVVTHMSSASSASKADGKTASAYRYKYEIVLADQHRMLQDNEAGLDFNYDLNNLASLAVLTLFLEEGLQRKLKISLDSRLSYKFLKRLTGGAGLNSEVGEVRAEEGCWHDLQRDLQRADCMGVDPLVFALTRDTPLTHKGGGKKFANHSAVNNWLSGMAALVDVLGIMRVLADASVMRIILMINAIADGPHSTESSKTYPFSLRAAFTAEKVRLEEEVLTHNRMIGNISATSPAAAAVAVSVPTTRRPPRVLPRKERRRQTRRASYNRAPITRTGLSTRSCNCGLRMCK